MKDDQSNLFRNKYRISSFRAKWWDYSSQGIYFITICTENRSHYFGEIIDSKMHLNQIGLIAHQIWQEISNQFDFIVLDEFVVMPNHVHGILIIDNAETRLIASPQSSKTPTDDAKINGGFTKAKNPMFHDNISRVIRWYKGRCTFEIRKKCPGFQ